MVLKSKLLYSFWQGGLRFFAASSLLSWLIVSSEQSSTFSKDREGLSFAADSGKSRLLE
jgi:hypothetical protein